MNDLIFFILMLLSGLSIIYLLIKEYNAVIGKTNSINKEDLNKDYNNVSVHISGYCFIDILNRKLSDRGVCLSTDPDENIELMQDIVEEYASVNGLEVGSNLKSISRMLTINEGRCPCNADNICPCHGHIKDVITKGTCKCKLFKRPESV